MSCVAHPSTLARKRRAREARAADRNADGPEDNPRRTACIAGGDSPRVVFGYMSAHLVLI